MTLDFKSDAQEFCRKHNCPGMVVEITIAMQFGAEQALRETAILLAKTKLDLIEKRVKNNAPNS